MDHYKIIAMATAASMIGAVLGIIRKNHFSWRRLMMELAAAILSGLLCSALLLNFFDFQDSFIFCICCFMGSINSKILDHAEVFLDIFVEKIKKMIIEK